MMRRTPEEICLHNQKIMDYLNRDRKGSKVFCNRTLCSQGENFPINDGIVASMSQYFEGLFTTEMKEKYAEKVSVDTIPPKRLKTILDYIYTGDIELTEDNVLEVLEDADYAQVDDLKSFCSQTILEIISINNCLKLRAYATRYNLADVEKKTNRMIVDNIATVVQHDDFMQLDVGDMSVIIKQRGKNCEEVVFTGLVKWVNYNPHQREELFVNLFSQLDLSSMKSEFLQKVSKEDLVRNNLTCSNMLVDNFNKLVEDLLPGKGNHELNPGRSGLTSTRVEKMVYVMGGVGGEKKCQVLDLDENTWSEMPDMLEERQQFESAYLKGFIYVTGGHKKELSCEKLDITNKKWERMRNMLHERLFHATVVCNDLLYCIGDNNNEKSCECYNIEAEEWNEIASLNEGRSGLACAELDGYIYAIGGFSTATVEKYSPTTNEWKYVASMQNARNCPSACVVGNKIYVVGGRVGNDGTDIKSVEVYDPTSDVWTHAFGIDKSLYRGSAVAL